jgi:hypothetical protein
MMAEMKNSGPEAEAGEEAEVEATGQDSESDDEGPPPLEKVQT